MAASLATAKPGARGRQGGWRVPSSPVTHFHLQTRAEGERPSSIQAGGSWTASLCREDPCSHCGPWGVAVDAEEAPPPLLGWAAVPRSGSSCSPRPSPTAPQPPEKVSRDCLAYLFTLTQNRCMPAGRSSSRGCSDLNYQHPCLLEPSPMVPLHTDDSGSDGCSPATKRSRAKRPIEGRRGLRGLAVDKRESPV